MRKAQEGGGGAAALVAVIALFTILFIIMLPPEIRQEILDDTVDVSLNKPISWTDHTGKLLPANTLLLENPGRLYNLGDTTFTHSLPAIRLYTKVIGNTLYEVPKVVVKSTLFNKDNQKISFSGIKDIENAYLSFIIAEGSGVLVIKMNGNEIIREKFTEGNVVPINIPKTLFQNSNLLEFTIDRSSIAFWKTFAYDLREIKITADVIDDTRTSAAPTFYIDEDEHADIKRVKLFYSALCDRSKVGNMDIALNSERFFSGVPDCGNINKLEINPGDLVKGKNTLRFRLDEGIVNFNNLRIETQLRKPRVTTYYFEITPSVFDTIIDGDATIGMFMTFAGDENKEATVFVNGFILKFDTDGYEYFSDITPFVREGFNAIEIKPESTFDIGELRVAKSSRR